VVADPAASTARPGDRLDTPGAGPARPDEAFAPGSPSVVIDDEHAIVVEEHGFAAT
jgi:hypothetical protein